MTEKKAISVLKNVAWLGTVKDREDTETAVAMAVKSLEAWQYIKLNKYSNCGEEYESFTDYGRGYIDALEWVISVYKRKMKEVEE